MQNVRRGENAPSSTEIATHDRRSSFYRNGCACPGQRVVRTVGKLRSGGNDKRGDSGLRGTWHAGALVGAGNGALPNERPVLGAARRYLLFPDRPRAETGRDPPRAARSRPHGNGAHHRRAAQLRDAGDRAARHRASQSLTRRSQAQCARAHPAGESIQAQRRTVQVYFAAGQAREPAARRQVFRCRPNLQRSTAR